MLQQYINSHRESFNAYMMGLIEKENIPNELKESMLYSLSVGGKRLRPIILFAVLETLGLDAKKGYPTAAALEMIRMCARDMARQRPLKCCIRIH